MADILTILVKFQIRPGKKEAFLEELEVVVEEMSKEDSFINSFVTESLDDPNLLFNYETWAETKDSFFATQFTKPYRQPYEEAIKDLLVDREVSLMSAPHLRREAGEPDRWT